MKIPVDDEEDEFMRNLILSPSFITFSGFVLTTMIFVLISKIVSFFN